MKRTLTKIDTIHHEYTSCFQCRNSAMRDGKWSCGSTGKWLGSIVGIPSWCPLPDKEEKEE